MGDNFTQVDHGRQWISPVRALPAMPRAGSPCNPCSHSPCPPLAPTPTKTTPIAKPLSTAAPASQPNNTLQSNQKEKKNAGICHALHPLHLTPAHPTPPSPASLPCPSLTPSQHF